MSRDQSGLFVLDSPFPDQRSVLRLLEPSGSCPQALRECEHLEAFIFGWAALEMVIRKYTVRCETGDWVKSLADGDRHIGDAIHKDYVDGGHQHYSLAARARAFALIHRIGPGEDIAAEVTRIRNAYREPLYHEGTITDQLSAEAVVALVRKLLSAALVEQIRTCTT